MFYVVMPLTLLTMMAVGILYVRLRHGPIHFDFVVAPIEHGINAELTTSSVKIDGAELRLGPWELEFRFRDVSVLEMGGDVVLSSPLAAVNISMAALMRGRVVPARIELIDPIIALAYSEDTGFVFERATPASLGAEPASAARQPQSPRRLRQRRHAGLAGTAPQSQSDEDAERFLPPRATRSTRRHT